jgi:hypothetical protein
MLLDDVESGFIDEERGFAERILHTTKPDANRLPDVLPHIKGPQNVGAGPVQIAVPRQYF